jgi:hypothetical protein
MNTSLKLALAGILIAVAAWLAFGFFGIQAAFIDDEVSEANPFASIATSPADAGAPATEPQPVAVEGEQAQAPENVVPAEPAPADSASVEPETTQPSASEAPTEVGPEVVTLASGTLVDHAHAGEGTITVLTDGNQRFLRFEDDFAIDNGPDLNVYLVRDADAEGDSGLFDDDFIDLGDLKGNIGSQNYELDPDIDLGEYDTVVIWCVRFGVAFNAANLA